MSEIILNLNKPLLLTKITILKKSIYVFLFSIFSVGVFAQTAQIKGIVLSATDKPIENVSVQVKNKEVFTQMQVTLFHIEKDKR